MEKIGKNPEEKVHTITIKLLIFQLNHIIIYSTLRVEDRRKFPSFLCNRFWIFVPEHIDNNFYTYLWLHFLHSKDNRRIVD